MLAEKKRKSDSNEKCVNLCVKIRHDGCRSRDEVQAPRQKWKASFFEALDLIIATLTHRFDQKDLSIACAREKLILDLSTSEEDVKCQIQKCQLPPSMDQNRLKRQLLQFADLCNAKNTRPKSAVHVGEQIAMLGDLVRPMFNELESLVSIILSLPISAASAERSFSSLRRIKTWLRSTMSQSRLTHLCLLSVHRERVAKLNMSDLMHEFISKTPERCCVFGRF